MAKFGEGMAENELCVWLACPGPPLPPPHPLGQMNSRGDANGIRLARLEASVPVDRQDGLPSGVKIIRGLRLRCETRREDEHRSR